MNDRLEIIIDCHICCKRPGLTFHIPPKSVNFLLKKTKKQDVQMKPVNNKKKRKRKENAAVTVFMISKSSGDVDGLSPHLVLQMKELGWFSGWWQRVDFQFEGRSNAKEDLGSSPDSQAFCLVC